MHLPDVQKVLVSVAFVTEGGVEQIEAQLIAHAARVTVFAGIRNDATSYQGLVRLHRIVSQLYTVDTGSRTVLFHPKLYLVCGKKRARLIISSANLTLAGLSNNIEAGMLLDFDLTDVADKAEIEKIEMLFAASLTDYPSHVVKVANIGDLDELLAAGRLIDENVDSSSPSEFVRGDANYTGDRERYIDRDCDGVPRIKLKTKLLRSGIGKAGSVRKEMEHGGTPAVESESARTPMPASAVEFEPKGTATLLARSGIVETNSVPKEMEQHCSGPTAASEAAKPVMPVSAVEPEGTATFAFDAPNRRTKEGSRLRARRAKEEAIARGKKWYFTGEPCIYGHIADRLVSNGKCRECNRLDSERANRLGLYR